MPELTITAAEIIVIHDKVLAIFGGSPGVRVQGCLEQCLGSAELAEQYSGDESGLGLCFIGSVMFYINKNQCFVDGNKRTSLTVGLKLLGDLGVTLDVSPKELEEYCVRIAEDKNMTSGDVVRWVAEKVKAYEHSEQTKEMPTELAPPARKITLEDNETTFS